MALPSGVFEDLLLFNGRFDAREHFYDNAVYFGWWWKVNAAPGWRSAARAPVDITLNRDVISARPTPSTALLEPEGRFPICGIPFKPSMLWINHAAIFNGP
jgi:hypothetical protein